MDKKSIGPTYLDISKKYKKGSTNIAKLTEKIIKGGGGVWGEQAMAGHPQLANDDVREMVSYILTLNDPKKASQPIKAEYVTEKKAKDGSYIVTATYTDKGANKIAPQSKTESLILRNAKIKANTYDGQNKTMAMKIEPVGDIVIGTENKSYLNFNQLDLTSIGNINLSVFASDSRLSGGKIEVRIGSPTGKLIGEAEVKVGSIAPKNITIMPQTGFNDIYFVFVNDNNEGKPIAAISDIKFELAK